MNGFSYLFGLGAAGLEEEGKGEAELRTEEAEDGARDWGQGYVGSLARCERGRGGSKFIERVPVIERIASE